MWKEEINGIGQRFAEAYSIPKDVIANATLLHVVGMSEIFLENFKGIISYTCHEILVKGHDCKYCINRSSNDVVRTSFTPEEVCVLTMEFYRRNYIEGLFLSSGINHTPNQTMAEIVQALMLLREKYHFNGYIHCKAIPGADPDLVELAGWYADRMSVNLELPTTEGLRALAPHKNRKNIAIKNRNLVML